MERVKGIEPSFRFTPSVNASQHCTWTSGDTPLQDGIVTLFVTSWRT
jgi:hypothetical protein